MALLYMTAFFCSTFSDANAAPDLRLFADGLVAVLVSVAGANAVNCYYDRDIDGVMRRTQGRRMAITLLGNSQTFALGLSLIFASAALSIGLGIVPFSLLVAGVTFYLGLYTFLLKRKTPLNVFATFPSIASPAILGWYLGGSPLFPLGAVIAVIISVWGPLHLWTLAFAFSKDYTSVEIPMLASRMTPRDAAKLIMVTLLVQVATSYLLLASVKTAIYLIGVSIVNIIILYFGYEFYKAPSVSRAYRVFKFTAPYIVAVLAIFMIDQFV